MLNGAFSFLSFFFLPPPSLHFLEGSKQSILSLFSFLLLHFSAGVWLYVLPAAGCSLCGAAAAAVGLFCLANMSRCQGPEPPASPAAEENDRMWRSDGGGETLQPARRCVYADSDAGINFIMSSATAYSSSSRGFSYVLWSGWRGAWLAFRSLIFTASLNPWPSVIAFKAVKPQHPSLSFIIYVCGLRGGKKKIKLMRRKSRRRGIQIAWVLASAVLTKRGNERSFLWFTLSYYCPVCSCSLLLPFSSLDIALSLSLSLLYCSFFSLSPLSFFGCLSFCLSLSGALWDLVPAGLTSSTMKQMLILIILPAEISLWSNLMLGKATCCTPREAVLLKCDLVTKGNAGYSSWELLHLSPLYMYFSRPGILHDAQSKHCANYSPISHWSRI